MKHLFRHFVLLASVQALVLSAAVAADKVVEKPVAADTPEKFAEVSAQIRKEMGVDGRYEFISSADKVKANTDLDSMAAMLQKSGSVSAMPKDEQLQLFNTQEHLNGILTHSDRNRLVCESRRPMGSNIPQNTCRTVADIEKQRRDSQKYMNDHAQDANTNRAAISKTHGDRGF